MGSKTKTKSAATEEASTLKVESPPAIEDNSMSKQEKSTVKDETSKTKSTFSKTAANKGAVLQFTLEHGDIVIMHGEKIQKLYEVSQNYRFRQIL